MIDLRTSMIFKVSMFGCLVWYLANLYKVYVGSSNGIFLYTDAYGPKLLFGNVWNFYRVRGFR